MLEGYDTTTTTLPDNDRDKFNLPHKTHESSFRFSAATH